MNALKNLLFENWNLKLTAILIAVTLWLVVRGDSAAARVITVPLEVRVPRFMEITNERPSSVDVTVRGTVSNIWFGQSIPTCTVDLQSADEGEHIVPLSPANVRIPRATGLEVLSVRPARITLRLERSVTREVTVTVTLQGDPAQGFEVYRKTASPATVLLIGPRSRIDRIREVATESVSIAGARDNLRAHVNLDIRDSFVRCSADGIDVTVELGVHRRLQTIARVPVQADNGEFSVTPPRITVLALVPVYYRERLTAADFTARLPEGTDFSAPATRVRPDVRFTARSDPNVVIREVQPAEVTVQRKPKK
jgi:YbbR domain-containing protein